MSMSLVFQLLIGIVGLTTALIPLIGGMSRTKALRQGLVDETTAWQEIPQESPAYEAFESLVVHDIRRLDIEEEKTRSGVGIGLALSLILIATTLGILAVSEISRWWLIVAGVSLVLGLAGLGEDATRQLRDARGRVEKGNI